MNTDNRFPRTPGVDTQTPTNTRVWVHKPPRTPGVGTRTHGCGYTNPHEHTGVDTGVKSSIHSVLL